MVTRSWKVYGLHDGETQHRQRESFCRSYKWDFSKGDDIRIVDVENSDLTGTNDYTIVRITRNTAAECQRELYGQISDGIFENCRVGLTVEIDKESREMKVEELLDENKGNYDAYEIYEASSGYKGLYPAEGYHLSIIFDGLGHCEDASDMEVMEYDIVGNDEYNDIFSNSEAMDFADDVTRMMLIVVEEQE